MKTLWTAILVSLALAVLPARGQSAAPVEPEPGEYLTEGDWGMLTISPQWDQMLGYSLEAQGPNGHMCGFEGTIQGNRGDIDSGPNHRPARPASSRSSGTPRGSPSRITARRPAGRPAAREPTSKGST